MFTPLQSGWSVNDAQEGRVALIFDPPNLPNMSHARRLLDVLQCRNSKFIFLLKTAKVRSIFDSCASMAGGLFYSELGLSERNSTGIQHWMCQRFASSFSVLAFSFDGLFKFYIPMCNIWSNLHDIL